jgi:ubiquinone/menaquinone biosynthesis C-methylase UbiE
VSDDRNVGAGSIDFHSQSVSGTYTSRTAGEDWGRSIRTIVDPQGAIVADIGCGGGIYSRAWSDLGASRVVGIDFSTQMVSDATAASTGFPALTFSQGNATDTGLPDAWVDIVFERALIHHLPDPGAAFAEARRILKPGGVLIVQDRTMDDVLQPASPSHFRGYFFEAFPRLLEIERRRRPDASAVAKAMTHVGFTEISSAPVPEVRRTYASLDELQTDLRARTGRSILHELTDSELDLLIGQISERVADSFPLREVDYWTIWTATSPG